MGLSPVEEGRSAGCAAGWKAALSVTGAIPGGRWPSLLMAEKGVNGSTGREANSWGAAEREAGDQAGGEERFDWLVRVAGEQGRRGINRGLLLGFKRREENHPKGARGLARKKIKIRRELWGPAGLGQKNENGEGA